tara:strand:- start:2 stop:847 length:846 start_codon:yes stop_codon:yes gene_type:complete
MIWIPFTGAISEATGTIIEKIVLRKRKIGYKTFVVYMFLAIVLVSIPFLYFFWKLDSQAFEMRNILIFSFIILVSIMANLLMAYSLKREDVSELEPLRLLQPLFVILLAFIIYSSERKISILIAALIASGALMFSHIEKHHFKFNKYLIAALFASLFFAIELVATKSILPFYSGFTFYFLRCSFVFLITLAIFRPSHKNIDNTSKILILITGGIWVFYRVLLYYGYIAYGVVFTTLLFILAPVFIYAFARIFLKEKLTWRNIVATIVILLCVSYAIWTSYA